MFIMEFAFWTPEMLTMFRSLNRSTNRIYKENSKYIESNSTRLESVTCELETELPKFNHNFTKMMLNVFVVDMDTLKLLVKVNQL